MSKKLIHVARQKLPVAFNYRATFLSSVEQGIIGIYFCSHDPLGGVTLGCPPSVLLSFLCVRG